MRAAWATLRKRHIPARQTPDSPTSAPLSCGTQVRQPARRFPRPPPTLLPARCVMTLSAGQTAQDAQRCGQARYWIETFIVAEIRQSASTPFRQDKSVVGIAVVGYCESCSGSRRSHAEDMELPSTVRLAHTRRLTAAMPGTGSLPCSPTAGSAGERVRRAAAPTGARLPGSAFDADTAVHPDAVRI